MKTFKCRGKDKPIDPPSVFPSSTSTQLSASTSSSNSASHSHSSSSSSFSTCPSPSTSTAKPRPTKRVLSSVWNVSPDQLGPFLEQDQLIFEDILKKLSGSDMAAFKIDEDQIGVQPRVKRFLIFRGSCSYEA